MGASLAFLPFLPFWPFWPFFAFSAFLAVFCLFCPFGLFCLFWSGWPLGRFVPFFCLLHFARFLPFVFGMVAPKGGAILCLWLRGFFLFDWGRSMTPRGTLFLFMGTH